MWTRCVRIKGCFAMRNWRAAHRVDGRPGADQFEGPEWVLGRVVLEVTAAHRNLNMSGKTGGEGDQLEAMG